MKFKLFKSILIATILISASFAKDKNIVNVGDDVTINAHERVETVVVIGGDLTVYGEIEESAFVIGGDIFIREGASIEEDAISIGGKIFVDPGGEVEGEMVDVTSRSIKHIIGRMDFDHLGWDIHPILGAMSLFGILTIGLIGILLFPSSFKNNALRFSENPLKTLGWGVLSLFLFVPVIVLLCLTIIGIPLVPLWVCTYWLSYLGGYLSMGTLLGGRLLSRWDPDSKVVLSTLLGIFILWIGGQVPFAGGIIKGFIWLSGLGLLLSWVMSRRSIQKEISG